MSVSHITIIMRKRLNDYVAWSIRTTLLGKRAHPSGGWLFAAGCALLAASSAVAETPLRVRGVVVKLEAGSLTIKQQNGQVIRLATSSDTSYAFVVPSSLEAIKADDFVGTAVKVSDNSMMAVEVALIPEDMRSGRISLYDWDPLPDPTDAHASTTPTKMINGLVSKTSSPGAALTNTKMVNGIVSEAMHSTSGRILEVSYDGGRKSFLIGVPDSAPIVRYVLADRMALELGSAVMIKTNPGNQASLVTIGKGVRPPM
ncbi:metal ABC transporter permease [Rhizobium leguminosarum]|uniref:metal ABC transporter permease n=1 Tax=Rhizobium leguminosarum TaxID=384 RepID=UPI001030E8FF|nr:metal ABC transporter permease [Rhizobium leguminosarum]TBC86538.1 metal ABC transporter permease [Rhizobium leguminosarum]